MRRLRHAHHVGLLVQERGGRFQDKRIWFLIVLRLHVQFLFLLPLKAKRGQYD
jgi:hypothetical protein